MPACTKRNTLPILLIAAWFVLAGCRSAAPAAVSMASSGAPVATDPDLKVAFIGDSDYGANFEAVLRLIRNEGADLVLHQGDFDYALDADGFFARIDSVLGPDYPYLVSVGNHDIASWHAGCDDSDGCYAELLSNRMARIGIAPDHPDLNDQMYTVTYRGLKIVFVGEQRAGDRTYAPYIARQLAADPHIWKICSWHKNQHTLQVGAKPDAMGWRVYGTCKDSGAIIVNGHEHSYERTRTLTDMQNLTVDTTQHPLADGVPGNPNQLLVAPGRSFVVVSGLGGHDMRDQERCRPFTYPYGGGPGCNYIWASIYTSNQAGGAQKFGALFMIFNYNGDPNKAHGYFKTSDGMVVDEFDVTSIRESPTPG